MYRYGASTPRSSSSSHALLATDNLAETLPPVFLRHGWVSQRARCDNANSATQTEWPQLPMTSLATIDLRQLCYRGTATLTSETFSPVTVSLFWGSPMTYFDNGKIIRWVKNRPRKNVCIHMCVNQYFISKCVCGGGSGVRGAGVFLPNTHNELTLNMW